jgi:ADP-ribose pyrophosphatase YjhB (NUDIX family)
MVGEPAIANFCGREIYLSVGAVIRNSEGKILMIDRLKTPYGFACPAGHIDKTIPMLKKSRRNFPEQYSVYENIKFVMTNQIQLYTALNKEIKINLVGTN